MHAAMTIEEFSALMKAEEREDHGLIKILRELTALDEPDKVRVLKGVEPTGVGWR